MESRVRVLPEQLASQIAAGEVVERPASVVKELVENALDAGAKTVDIDLSEGGRQSIVVTDDGTGMSPEDARLSFERHATSKIRTSDDLTEIATFGFRGEALPSIASIARVVLTTKPEGAISGFRMEVAAGKIESFSERGCPLGTRIEVRDIFFNTPARRKYLKTVRSELGRCSAVVTAFALAYPEVAFRLRHGERTLLDVAANRPDTERLSRILNAEVAGDVYPVKGEWGLVKVHGLVSSPGLARRNNQGLYTFVNRRFIRDRMINHAIQSAYGSLLEPGRYPWAVLYLEMPLDTVDVNVHPSKTEVRFIDPNAIHSAVEKTLAETLRGSPWIRSSQKKYNLGEDGEVDQQSPGAPVDGFEEHRLRVREALARYGQQRVDRCGQDPGRQGRQRAGSGGGGAFSASSGAFGASIGKGPPLQSGNNAIADEKAGGQAARLKAFAGGAALPLSATVDSPSKQPMMLSGDDGYFSSLEVLGPVGGVYIVCRGHDGLVLIDQHAAHERITFNTLKETYGRQAVQSQELLFPETMELTHQQIEAAQEYDKIIAQLGFRLEHFGGDTYVLHALPALLPDGRVRLLIADVLDELYHHGKSETLEERIDDILATMACHGSVRGGRTLSRAESQALMTQLDQVDFAAHCPHGRPVLLRIPLTEIAKALKRL